MRMFFTQQDQTKGNIQTSYRSDMQTAVAAAAAAASKSIPT